MQITKEITFDCAHMLSGHEGLCANLHGHTYKVQVTIYGKPLIEGPSMGMLLDFKDLKSIINLKIMGQFDHAVIFSTAELRNAAEDSLYDWARENGMRHFVMPGRPTAEALAEYFKNEIRWALQIDTYYDNLTGVSVKVWETPNSFAEAT